MIQEKPLNSSPWLCPAVKTVRPGSILPTFSGEGARIHARIVMHLGLRAIQMEDRNRWLRKPSKTSKDGLIEKDLIAFDGKIYQVLDLPPKPAQDPPKKVDPKLDRKKYRRHLKNSIQQSLWEAQDGQ